VLGVDVGAVDVGEGAAVVVLGTGWATGVVPPPPQAASRNSPAAPATIVILVRTIVIRLPVLGDY
jgi:hypothetical protein